MYKLIFFRGYIVPEQCADEATIKTEFLNKLGNNEKGLILVKQLIEFILASKELGVTVTQIKVITICVT